MEFAGTGKLQYIQRPLLQPVVRPIVIESLSHGNRYEFIAAVSHVCDNLSNTDLHADDSCSDDETDVYYTDSESASSSTDVVYYRFCKNAIFQNQR